MANYSIWPATNGPSTDAADPLAPVNMGHIFRVSVPFWVLKIRLYRGNTNVKGSPTGRIFTGVAGAAIAGTAVTFALVGTGWQEASLAVPKLLAANTTYKVVVNYPDNYTASANFWNIGAGVGGITNGPLVAPDAGGVPLGLGSIQQGSFKYTSDVSLNPDTYFNGGNYWVDLVITDTDPTVMAGSVADRARANMLVELGFTEPRRESNVDLMRQVVAKPGQLLVPVTNSSAATHYIKYLMTLR